jgi:phosphoglycolate phosphatase
VAKAKAETTMNQTVKSIVFDFDYTLADSSQGVIECVNFALAGMGFPPASTEQICRTIGLHLSTTYQVLTGESHPERKEAFIRLFAQRADQVMADRTVLFTAVVPTLIRLREKGIKLGIVSTKFHHRIASILAREGIETFFEIIVGGEDVQVHKPDPTGLHLAVEYLGCLPSEVVYVGDSVTDAETAKRGGMAFIAVLSGVTTSDEFQGYAPSAIIGSLSELPVALAE